MLRESQPASAYAELFQRHSANPILTAREWPCPAHTVFNAGACEVDGFWLAPRQSSYKRTETARLLSLMVLAVAVLFVGGGSWKLAGG